MLILIFAPVDTRITSISLKGALLAMADLAMPRVCVVCGRALLLRERHICTLCGAGLPLTYFARQRDNPMALAFNSMIQKEIDLAEQPACEPFSYAAALIFYSGSSLYKNIPRRLKYGRDFGEGRYFARLLGRELAGSPLFSDVDKVIPVPLHPLRRWRRGYNQAEVIAKGLVEGFGEAGHGAPAMEKGLLRRVRKTMTQTKLHRSQRYANVRSAFTARAPAEVPRHVLLVDDVFTTGATLCACERALRAVLGKDVRISAATLAYVGR